MLHSPTLAWPTTRRANVLASGWACHEWGAGLSVQRTRRLSLLTCAARPLACSLPPSPEPMQPHPPCRRRPRQPGGAGAHQHRLSNSGGPPAAAAPTAQEGRQPQRGTGSCTGDSRGQQWQAAATPADSRRRSAGHPLRRPEDRARSPVASTSRTENGVKELRPGRPQLHSHGLWHPPASP